MHNLHPAEVGQRIRAFRERAGLSQAELAARMGGGQSPVSKWERGTKQPSLASLGRIAEALGIDVVDLIGGGQQQSSGEAGSPGSDEERRAIAAARALTESLTFAWVRGQFESLDQLATSAREIASGYPAVGRGFVEGWIDLFRENVNADTHGGPPARKVREQADSPSES